MGKKKHPEHVNHERWLVSYADLLTLLFAFFVVLFASSVSDKKKSTKMARAMQVAFDPGGPFDAHSKTPPLNDEGGAAMGPANPLEMPVQTGSPGGGNRMGEGEAAKKALEASVTTADQKHLVHLHESDEGVTLSLDSAGFFDSGSAEIRPATLPLIRKIADALPPRPLRVEGHTDNHPIHTAQFLSNWELSTARAAAIAQVLMQSSTVSPANFSIAGYGEFHPVAPNATEEGRAANRRVDIVLLRPKAAAAEETTAKPATQKASLESSPKIKSAGEAAALLPLSNGATGQRAAEGKLDSRVVGEMKAAGKRSPEKQAISTPLTETTAKRLLINHAVVTNANAAAPQKSSPVVASSPKSSGAKTAGEAVPVLKAVSEKPAASNISAAK